MAQIYQDSIAIVRELGKPSLFVTVTANPHWREIQAELRKRQSATDRPDIIACVFEQKKKEILKDLRKEFGDYRGIFWTIGYQKRGLPHMHCLLFLSRDNNFLERAQVDEIVCAQLPNEELDPNGSLTELVKAHMIHGPCGVINPECVCMKDKNDGLGRRCKANYPKQFQEETIVSEDGYPLYQQKAGTWN